MGTGTGRRAMLSEEDREHRNRIWGMWSRVYLCRTTSRLYRGDLGATIWLSDKCSRKWRSHLYPGTGRRAMLSEEDREHRNRVWGVWSRVYLCRYKYLHDNPFYGQ